MQNKIIRYPALYPAFKLTGLLLVLTLSCNRQESKVFPGVKWQKYKAPEAARWSAEGLAVADQLADSIGTAAYMVVYRGAVVHTYGDITRRYCWWTMSAPFDRYNGFLASGFRGHRLVILPALDLVFVHRMNTYTKDQAGSHEIFTLLQQVLDAQTGKTHRNPVFAELELDTRPKGNTISGVQCSEYAGTYISQDGKELVVTCENVVLWVHDNLAGNYQVLQCDSSLMLEYMEKEIVFMRDSKRGIQSLSLGKSWEQFSKIKDKTLTKKNTCE